MVTRASTVGRFPRRSGRPTPEPLALRILEWSVFVVVLTILVARFAMTFSDARQGLPTLGVWLLVVTLTDLLPVPLWGNLTLALSLPVLLAAGMLYPPHMVGLLAFVGSADPREISHEVSFAHSLHNRSQVALSVMTASWVFHVLGGDPLDWPLVVPLGLAALSADFAVNLSMVVSASRLAHQQTISEVLWNVYGGEPLTFLSSYVCFGLIAVLIAVVCDVAGLWGLAAFVIPISLARQVFVQSRRLRDMADAVSAKTRALLAISERIADERREERLAVAADLHDEVLPPLYEVHLMGQVVRQDLATGQLLALEDDVPDLVRATAIASAAMRDVIRDLRRSRLGPGGLSETLRLLVRHLQQDAGAQIHLEIDGPIGGSPLVQLLAYQVAREALRNSLLHSRGKNVWVRLARDGADMRLSVEDDGCGFSQELVDREKHFGLQLMRERIELAGGMFEIVSDRNRGTTVIAKLPAETVAI
jgi:signal transduction histidine kinase